MKKPPALKRTRLKPISKKRTGWLAAYREKKKSLGSLQKCAVCGSAIQIGLTGSWHHPMGRRTLEALLTIIPVCELTCHRKIHAEPNWAMANGYLHPEYRKTNESKTTLAHPTEGKEGEGPAG